MNDWGWLLWMLLFAVGGFLYGIWDEDRKIQRLKRDHPNDWWRHG